MSAKSQDAFRQCPNPARGGSLHNESKKEELRIELRRKDQTSDVRDRRSERCLGVLCAKSSSQNGLAQRPQSPQRVSDV